MGKVELSISPREEDRRSGDIGGGRKLLRG